ncbi:MAG: hypothetical protein M1828_003952 [Chrysothrix sp. TS-e1954]|nr:MAG: hypothetical protein M1828_003952 [Chrysothrix sp. TS-e1954]
MSRRAPNPGADRAAQNQQTLKTLVKVEGNKTCADCKKNKHPRWASWNLGIFLCIRGMGTHISRVKSVDLDSWTDEQLQSMLRWGNGRANKYWEAKLAPGHVPAEAKIENFIRTKYDSKRWVMDGGMPDPASLDTPGDDEVPLNVVQEKAKLDRVSSTRTAPPSVQPILPPKQAPPPIDLFDDGPISSSRPTAPRSSSATPSGSRPLSGPTQVGPPQKQNKIGDSLLGFDFFGSSASSPVGRPSSATGSGASVNVPSRPDLKQSILSLYASAPRSSAPGQPTHSRTSSTAQTNNITSQSGSPQNPQPGLADAFGGLTFSTPAVQSPPITSSNSSHFAGLSSPSQRPTSGISSFPVAKSVSTGGNFFNSGTPSNPTFAPPTTATSTSNATKPQRGLSASSGFGDFTGATSPAAVVPSQQTPNSGLDDFWGPSDVPAQPSRNPAPIKAPTPSIPSTLESPFNLSSPKRSEPEKSQPEASVSKPPNTSAPSLMNMNPWGSDNAWASAAPTSQTSPLPSKGAAVAPSTSDPWGWSGQNGSSTNSAPKVAADEDFGGWESGATPVSAHPPAVRSPLGNAPKPSGNSFTASEDLFSNVWG